MSMERYVDFAYLYDTLMLEDIDYKSIADYIESIFSGLPKRPNLVLDLACGTGTLTGLLNSRGYDMVGVDVSTDMLNVAKEKNPDILYLCQDMRQFELYGTVDAIVCMTDSLNYITQPSELIEVFRLTKNYLNPGAPFIFDMNSAYKLSHTIKNNTFTYDSDGIFYVWENQWDGKAKLCDFFLTFFVQDRLGLYRRFDETHTQRAYERDEIETYLTSCGFSHVKVFDGYTHCPPEKNSQRLVYVAY